jgi:large subunit ribosomal protein L9
VRVLLRSDVEGVGKRGEIVDVADGYARNYLVPRGSAITATQGVRAQAEAMRRSRERQDARERDAAEEVARRLVSTVLRVPVRAGADGRLFGSVTSTDVAEVVEAQTGVSLDRRRIDLAEPLKSLGAHEIPVKLHADVELHLTLEVVSSS